MNAKRFVPCGAALLLGAAFVVVAAPAHADCGCPAGKEVLTVATSTTADKCGLEIVLREIERRALSADTYHVYVKSKLLTLPPHSPPIVEQKIRPGPAIAIPITAKPGLSCTTLLIAGKPGPQNGLVQFQWTYF